jgi:hypothetical protein
MGHVGFATAAALAIVRLFGVEVGSANQVDLVMAEIGRKSVGESVYTSHGVFPS